MDGSALKRWLPSWRPGGVCHLCGARAEPEIDMCQACQADLPYVRSACDCCGMPLPLDVERCGQCQRKPPAWDRAWVPFRYAWPLAPLLTRCKFGADLVAGRVLATAWVQQAWPERPELLIPVPLHPARLRQRGYNQALEFAKVLARQGRLPLWAEGLRRTQQTVAQTGLDASARRRNVRSAFGLAVPATAWPRHVALVDDVMTTGATLNACAQVLKAAGVSRVDVWVLARAVLAA